MKFVNIRELSKSPSRYIKGLGEKGDVIVTRNGRPVAVISGINGDELEDYILARHFDLENQFKRAQQEHESDETTDARELLKKIERAGG
jgi:antitoxin (DNA-binding transcriptional repressor) of toxin-antitoxin stability system